MKARVSSLARRPANGSVWRIGFIAAGLSALANTLLFALAVAAGVFPSLWLQADAGPQMFLAPVVLVSAVAALIGTAVFAAMRRAFEEPFKAFLIVAAVVLAASFAAPFVIPGTSVVQGVVLNVMHVMAAACTVGVLARHR